MRLPRPLPGSASPLFQQAPPSSPHAAIHARKPIRLAVLEVSIPAAQRPVHSLHDGREAPRGLFAHPLSQLLQALRPRPFPAALEVIPEGKSKPPWRARIHHARLAGDAGSAPLRRYYGRSDSRRAALAGLRHEHRLTPAGLPDDRKETSGHCDSYHRRDDRGARPVVRRFGLAPVARVTGLAFGSQARPSTPTESSSPRRPARDRLCFGRVVPVPVLSTPPCGDAVPVRYRTALHRTGADLHRSIPSPSQAHGRGLEAASTSLRS